jgi:hypothetical protein
MSISCTETSTTIPAATPTKIAAAAPGIVFFTLCNNGTNPLVWKCGAAPTSATDGLPLDPASASGGQGGSIVLTGDSAISDAIWAWSTGGTTVNVKQGFLV